MGAILNNQPNMKWLLLVLGILILPFFWTFLKRVSSQTTSTGTPVKEHWLKTQSRSAAPVFLGLVSLQMLVFFFFWPSDASNFGRHIGVNPHMGSFIFGPSLYFHADGLIPGKDFESHYGVGHAYLFYLLQPVSFADNMTFFFQYLIFFLSFFFLTGFLVLRRFFGASLSAWFACVIMILLCLESNNYATPSNWPLRFPFLFLFIGACAKTNLWNRAWPATALGGLLGGLSLFWQTDIGIYYLLAGIGLHLLGLRDGMRYIYQPFVFLACFFAAFLVLMVATYGPGALSVAAVLGVLKPIYLYSNGFGSHLITWKGGWTCVVSIFMPLLTLGILALAAYQLTRRDEETNPGDTAMKYEFRCLFLFSAVGLLMLLKWVNRSIDVVWFVNAYPLAVLLVWTCRQAAKAWAESLMRMLPNHNPKLEVHLVRMSGAAIGLGLGTICLFASLFHDPSGHGGSSSPLMRMKLFVHYYPSMANEMADGLKLGSPPEVPIAAEDVKFIRSHSAAKEPVTIISGSDWIYLLEAQRAPRFYWVQFFLTHSQTTLQKNLDSLNASDKIFVENGSLDQLKHDNPTLYLRVEESLRTEFTLVARGNRLQLHRRRESSRQVAKSRGIPQ